MTSTFTVASRRTVTIMKKKSNMNIISGNEAVDTVGSDLLLFFENLDMDIQFILHQNQWIRPRTISWDKPLLFPFSDPSSNYQRPSRNAYRPPHLSIPYTLFATHYIPSGRCRNSFPYRSARKRSPCPEILAYFHSSSGW